MSRPFTRAQALQNAAFLKQLRRTGNVHAACRALDVNRSTFTKRRARNQAFAADWDAALAIAHAALHSRQISARIKAAAKQRTGPGAARATTKHDAPVAIRTRSGRLQLRRAPPRRLTRSAEQAFLAALSATANIRLSAAAAGFSHSAFYHRRKQSPAFAREMRLALERGYEQVEMALIESFNPASYADDAWRHNDPPPMPRMTADQGLQLLYLHHKEVRLQAEPAHIKRRRGENTEAHSYRLAAMYRAKQARDAEAGEIALAAQAEGRAGSPHEPPPPVLPSLDQVTGWSNASDRPAHHEGRALFGGWRAKDMEG